MKPSPVALVTGARKGIGRYLAGHLAAAGYRVVGCSREPAEESISGYEHVLTDVTQEDQVVKLLAHVRERYGILTALINNAGIASMNSALLTPGATAGRIMHTNFLGSFLVARESAKLMMSGGGGRIVNFSTVAVPMQLEGESVYASSKAAVETLTKVLARELAPVGITVNAVGPPPIDTDLTRGVPRPKLEAVVARLATRRAATLEDVANVVDFLLRPESSAVTGQIIYLGGP
jgi:3-oxoacyl-[acyl-carrier protein] reductase